MSDFASHPPPLKRGKVLPERLSCREWSRDDELLDEKKHKKRNEEKESSGNWSESTLIRMQQRCWARLVHQRQPYPALDMISRLPDDLLYRITGFLDASSLLGMRCLNQRYRNLCARNEAGWDHLCQKLWQDKVHISASYCNDSNSSSSSRSSSSKMKAYQESARDATERQSVTLSEFCYDPATGQGTVWSFRFKASAGSEWTSVDPWYKGEPCRKMVFLMDGTVKQYEPGLTTTTITLQTPHFGRPSSHQPQPHPQQEEGAAEEQRQHNNNTTMTWRFITKPMDLPARTPLGSYVRITVGGREVPTYSMRRSPTGNWGFVMESCWGLFASFELPPRRSMVPRPPVVVLRRTTRLVVNPNSHNNHHIHNNNNNGWVDIHLLEEEDDDDDDDDDVENENVHLDSNQDSQSNVGGVVHQSRRRQPRRHGPVQDDDDLDNDHEPPLSLQDDSYMVITNEIQWREAFLYNVGARILPEGNEATDDFDRAWGHNNNQLNNNNNGGLL